MSTTRGITSTTRGILLFLPHGSVNALVLYEQKSKFSI